MNIALANIILSLLFYTQIYTNFHSSEKAVAFTFDACETKTPAYIDKELINYIIENKVPVTLFLSGKFIERNVDILREISKYDFIEVENHSYSHANFKKLKEEDIILDVEKNHNIIKEVTGREPRFFRFPYGEYNDENLKIIERMGYKVVHWSFPSGDPDRTVTKEQLISGVLKNLRSGNIIIFHINGRGWQTKFAFPEIVKKLKEEGYRFYLLKDCFPMKN